MNKIAQYIYTTYALIVFILTFIIQFPFFIFFSLWGEKGVKPLNILLRCWSKVFFFYILITTRTYGLENIEKNKKYIIVANHSSFLDTPMIFATIPLMVKPLARADFGKIPLFGYIYRKMTIPVDRSSTISKKKSYEQMVETVIKEKSLIFIFPEGSFNETEADLKKFYNGAFNLAKDTQTEILPVLFPDTVKRWHYSSFWAWSSGICRTFVLEPISINTINSMSVEELNKHTYNIMDQALKAIRKS